jgi:Tol biopolymer transport system component
VGSVGEPAEYGQIALAPDERTVVVEKEEGGQRDLWLVDLVRGVGSRVTATPAAIEVCPVWAPDGRSIVFTRWQTGKAGHIVRKGLRASDPEAVLAESGKENYPESVAADGKTLFYLRRASDGGLRGWGQPIEGGEAVEVVRSAGSVDELQPSPDGRFIAYMSNESGRFEVYVEPLGRAGERMRVSANGGGQPKWRGDGRELFYVSASRRLMAVPTRPQADRIEVGAPAELFEVAGYSEDILDDYAPSRSGERFLVKVPVDEERKARLLVITNWTGLLEAARP